MTETYGNVSPVIESVTIPLIIVFWAFDANATKTNARIKTIFFPIIINSLVKLRKIITDSFL